MPLDSDAKLRFYQHHERLKALEDLVQQLWTEVMTKEKAPTPVKESRPRICSHCHSPSNGGWGCMCED